MKKEKFMPLPRYYNAQQVAARLGVSIGTFQNKRPSLEKAGFPLYDELFKGWDAEAIEHFCDQRSGLRDMIQHPEEEFLNRI